MTLTKDIADKKVEFKGLKMGNPENEDTFYDGKYIKTSKNEKYYINGLNDNSVLLFAGTKFHLSSWYYQKKIDYLFIDDAVDGIIQAIQSKLTKYNVINISSGKRYHSAEIIKLVQEISHKKLNLRFNKTVQDEKCIWANISKAKKLLKFSPKISIKQGLTLTLNDLEKRSNT